MAKVLSEMAQDYFRRVRGQSPDIGGHEYMSGGCNTTPPAAPRGLTIQEQMKPLTAFVTVNLQLFGAFG